MDTLWATLQSFLQQNTLTLVILSIAFYLLLRQYVDSKRRQLPPGPMGLPIVGYIPFLPFDYEDKMRQLFKRYGRMFTLTLGSSDVVFVADIELLKSMMKQDVFNYRPEFTGFSAFDVLGECEYQ